MTNRLSVPMAQPDITDAERDAVKAVLETSHLSFGPFLGEFEKTFRAYTGASEAIAVSSGTAGLHLALIAADVGPGDLVITTPFSFVASANVILYQQAIPVFVDVEPLTGNIDCAQVSAAAEDLSEGRLDKWLPPLGSSETLSGKVSAILPVHAFGQPVDMDPILETARRFDLRVIEDSCEALGSEYRGRKAGVLGDIGVFAFYPNKQITTGEGGMIVTDRSKWADLCRSLRNQGRDVFDAWLRHTRLGYNYRIDEMSAALGVVQVRRLDEMIERRRQVAEWYEERLKGHPLIDPPRLSQTTSRISWFVYVVRVQEPAQRNLVMERLLEKGVPSRPYFSPIHLQPFYMERFGYRTGQFPVTERLGDVCLALPFSSCMSEREVDYVCRCLVETVSGGL